MSLIRVFLLIIVSYSLSLISACKWYGDRFDIALYPMDVCANSIDESEMDGYSEFSYKYECVDSNEMQILYHNTTDCSSTPFATVKHKKSDGYFFNCDSTGMCPYVKMKFTELFNSTDDHSCDIDPHNFQEFSLITDTCWEFPYFDNATNKLTYFSYFVDCSASKVLFELFEGKSCKMSGLLNSTTVYEGCDDPFDSGTYFQVVDCEDNMYEPTTTDNGQKSKSDDSESNNLAIIFTVVIAVIVIAVGVMVAVAVIRKKKTAQMGFVSGGLQGNSDLAKPIAFERLEDGGLGGDAGDGNSNVNSDALTMDDADHAR